MSILADCLRSYWAPGLNQISGNVYKDLRNWLADEDYQMYSPQTENKFVTSFADAESFLAALAADVNRMAAAAFESISHARKDKLFPRSTAWIIIKSYYASFFAAHAVLRMLGKGIVYLEQPHTRSINKIARAFGTWTEDVTPGTFCCVFVSPDRLVNWHRIEALQVAPTINSGRTLRT